MQKTWFILLSSMAGLFAFGAAPAGALAPHADSNLPRPYRILHAPLQFAAPASLAPQENHAGFAPAQREVRAAQASTSVPGAQAPESPAYPVRLIVPSAGISSPIEGVGTTAGGAMAVPSGKTNDVGWYKYGTVPGEDGSAVIDAHVFAAFSRLAKVKSGDTIFVEMSDGSTRRFLVSAVKTYPTAGLPSSALFRPTSSADLNLITCAGSLTPNHSTYDHRLIVYSTLMRE